MTIQVVSFLHNPNSKLNLLANEIANVSSTSVLNIAELDLPLCDGFTCYKDPKVIALQEQLKNISSFIFCSPIYCYDVNAITKNFIELCGQQLSSKVIGIAVTAGGSKSYMAPLSFIQSLSLDFRCHIPPKYLYVESADYDDNLKQFKTDIQHRIQDLVNNVVEYSRLLI